MSWLFLVLICIVAWGITDILYKKSSDYNDRMSHLKCLVWNGIVMAVIGLAMTPFYTGEESAYNIVMNNLALVPVGLMYPVALMFGLIGKRHLDASIVSPLENIDGAMAATILYFYFLFIGDGNIVGKILPMDMAATGLIVLGIVLLGVLEHRMSKREIGIAEDKKRHRLGALALLFPLIYNLVDAVSMVAIGIAVGGGIDNGISDVDFFLLESLCFFIVAAAVWIYMLTVKKYRYNPFKKQEMTKFGAALGETIGTLTFVFAVALNPILTAPITSSYCFITVITARIFLKERLSKKQFFCLALLLIGIALLGISEIMKA